VEVVGIEDDGALAAMAEGLLEVVISNNRYLMRAHPGRIPPLRSSGVRFRAEPWASMPPPPAPGMRPLPPIEQFCPLPIILRRGWADCAQLCAWRVAELRESGESDAALRFYCRSQGDGASRRRWYHVEVRRGAAGGSEIEDPSRELDF
jgi:hypothetical protein